MGKNRWEDQLMQQIKTTFKTDEIQDAVLEIIRARLVENWRGYLALESDGYEIFITQYAGSNSWTKGYKIIYSIEDYQDWYDFLPNSGVSLSDESDRIELEKSEWKNWKDFKSAKEIDNEKVTVLKQELWDELPVETFENQIEYAQEGFTEEVEN